ncbi:MAG: zinc-binding dehydrogenase [Rhabdochlamydiaceae bacterium]
MKKNYATSTKKFQMKRINQAEVLEGIQKGWLKLRIDCILPLSQAAEAHRLLENRQTAGKVLLTV